MQNPKNKQLISNMFKKYGLFFIKSCCFLFFFLLISCGSDTSNKNKAPDTTSNDSEISNENHNNNETILFFGNSLTAGYGLTDIHDAFPGIIQSYIDSLSMNYTVINSGLSGETTAGGKNRINWVLNQKVDVFVLELGANDGLRGISLMETRENLQAIIDAVRSKNSATKIILAGMQLPPNMGQDYIEDFKKIFPELAEKNKIHLVPFLLKDVGGIPELNQRDGIHPTSEGQKILAKNVWVVMESLISDAAKN